MKTSVMIYIKACCRGVAQVMLQDSPLTGVLFLAGILAGCMGLGGYGHMSVLVGAVGALLLVTPMSRFLLRSASGMQGLYGFNAVLVGCAALTFLSVDELPLWMYFMAVFMTLPLKKLLDMAFARIGASSLTLPFILATWILIYVARWQDVSPYIAEDIVEIPVVSVATVLSGWMKGVSQVFLIDSWIAGLLFVVGLWMANYRCALWALCGSAVGMAMAALCGCEWSQISQGLWGFSPVLTAIAAGVTFRPVNATWRWHIMTVVAIMCTFVMQMLLTPVLVLIGMPVLTLPFCMVTWPVVVYANRGLLR